MRAKITADHLERTALVYVRQSTPGQVRGHVESQRRQYALADVARDMGFRRVETIDDDLGISGSGFAERPGFQRLLTTVGWTRGSEVTYCLEGSVFIAGAAGGSGHAGRPGGAALGAG